MQPLRPTRRAQRGRERVGRAAPLLLDALQPPRRPVKLALWRARAGQIVARPAADSVPNHPRWCIPRTTVWAGEPGPGAAEEARRPHRLAHRPRDLSCLPPSSEIGSARSKGRPWQTSVSAVSCLSWFRLRPSHVDRRGPVEATAPRMRTLSSAYHRHLTPRAQDRECGRVRDPTGTVGRWAAGDARSPTKGGVG